MAAGGRSKYSWQARRWEQNVAARPGGEQQVVLACGIPLARQAGSSQRLLALSIPPDSTRRRPDFYMPICFFSFRYNRR
jgi:hypothetical protein